MSPEEKVKESLKHTRYILYIILAYLIVLTMLVLTVLQQVGEINSSKQSSLQNLSNTAVLGTVSEKKPSNIPEIVVNPDFEVPPLATQVISFFFPESE